MSFFPEIWSLSVINCDVVLTMSLKSLQRHANGFMCCFSEMWLRVDLPLHPSIWMIFISFQSYILMRSNNLHPWGAARLSFRCRSPSVEMKTNSRCLPASQAYLGAWCKIYPGYSKRAWGRHREDVFPVEEPLFESVHNRWIKMWL